MRFVIIGAGAIGGAAAAYLIRAGYNVLLVDNAADHVRAIEREGLTVEGREEFTVSADAVLPEMVGPALRDRPPQAVVLAVKSQHTLAALQPVLPHLRPKTFVLSMQNGLNPRVVGEAVGASRTLGACINSMGADYLRPSRIMFGGPGTIYLGELDGRRTSRVERLAEIFKTAFVANTHVTSNLWGYLWSKEGYGAMLFASATTDETMANVLGDAANESLLANLAGEVVRVAEAEGVRCEPFDGFDPDAVRFTTPRDWARIRRSLDSLAALNRRSLKQKSGIWRDLAVRHRPTEVDAQIGIVSEIGRVHGIRVPLVNRVAQLIHEIERGDRRMHPANIEELRTLDKRSYPEPSSK